jgi:hypothetical protein
MIEMSFNGRSPTELTELALRTALFKERNPLEDQHMAFFAEMPDPLEQLRAARVSDEMARPLAELLIVDALVGSGRAERVTEFRLGTAVRDARRLTLAWLPARRYSNEHVEPRTITGDVRL